ncbi:hypothetical protein NAEGRDRAFT_78553 [Naegleria gruberi]|uniref:SET domain-containing protein n=1 Tax=Naegleria gruberi TaxID=5762 RepID=D2V4K4_NAEGR|nr:uncharacterized protein NAEGRDRAFT_78553 [Naegleria gruberi]EFC48529.1 hypothetical protein NAEGRDRAFT_78553 [Naegleria gruberi]|eukprot:XP_002681273.1 hypothetical protein NAEGRDRAFT_78553 [Naegleria gruberi strain NEG-M]
MASSPSHTIHETIPEGIAIKAGEYGFGLFATKFFAKNSSVYVGRQIVIPNVYAEFTLITDQGTFKLNTDTHSVQFNENQRWLYLFDSFMNHSCDPSTISEQTEEMKITNQYAMVALRDINPGDQITCDYNIFEYDCHGKVIEKCCCGSSNCIGRVAGFKYLTLEEQKERIQFVDDEVLQAMAEDPTNKFMFVKDLKCPIDRVIIQSGPCKGYRMVASRSYKAGETIFKNHSIIFPEDTNIVVELNGKRLWLEKVVHTVKRGNGMREFYGFDTFQNHSCDPNSTMNYITDDDYELVAAKDINVGEEITSDYESFDEGLDGTTFECLCESAQCRGTIKG